ncbi:MAG: hypothetical protein WD276_06965 [Actinomycetota bacterium]
MRLRSNARLSFSIALAMVSSCTAAGDSGSSSECRTVPCKAATLDQGTYVAPDDPVIFEYQQAFEALQKNCSDSEERLADMAVVSQQQMQERGVTESLLSILEAVDASIPARLSQKTCADIFASYVVLRTASPN